MRLIKLTPSDGGTIYINPMTITSVSESSLHKFGSIISFNGYDGDCIEVGESVRLIADLFAACSTDVQPL